jgi:uncharacterized protein (DUF2141 family)
MKPFPSLWLCLPMALLLPLASAQALELVVDVQGLKDARGEVGCALYRSAEGFPMAPERAAQQWLPAKADGVECRFSALPTGRYAVAVSHDLNGNRKTDTNFVGMPTEAWGVSRGARPSLRAPRWDEAVMDLQADTRLTVVVAK